MFGVRSWSRTAYYSPTAKPFSTFFSILPWQLLTQIVQTGEGYMPDATHILTRSLQLELLQKKYDILLAETSPSPSRDRSNSRSNKQDEPKTNGSKKSARPDVVYTITPGAPHSERVLLSTQRKQVQKPISPEVEQRTEPRRNRSRPEQTSGGLGLHINGSNSDWSGAEDSASTPTMGSIPNDPRRRLYTMNSVEDLSILSPPESHGSFGHQHLHEILSSSASSSVIDISTPSVSTPSTLSWGTSIGSVSTISVGDMSLTGLPAFPSGSSLNLGVSGLPDFDHTTAADEADGWGSDENMMTPSLRRQPELVQEYNSNSGVGPRSPNQFEGHSAAGNRRPSVSRHPAVVETRNHDGPRPMGRSISDNISAMPVSRSLDQDEAELEVVGMRFSQSFSEVEPALYGYGSASTPSSFEDPAPIRNGVRRASIATPNIRGLDLDGIEGVRRSSASPVPPRPVLHRSVTFSTPKPDELPSKKHRDQGYGHPVHSSRGAVPKPNTTFPMPYPENTKGHPISSRYGPSDDTTRRGLATIAAPPRDLPPTHDPTYTAVGSSKRPLPSMHQLTPPLTHQHGRKEGQQPKQPITTRAVPPQSVHAPTIDIPKQAPSQAKPTVSANVPIVAPQPVNPIRPWKWNGKSA